jgi:hypothetical protein
MMSTPASITTNAGASHPSQQHRQVFSMRMGLASHHEVCELELLREKDSSGIPIVGQIKRYEIGA